ncbi:MAG: hypothetical protein HRT35_12135 [Algicola sp.]|nr:hypothetical protein [Algicola sp.]
MKRLFGTKAIKSGYWLWLMPLLSCCASTKPTSDQLPKELKLLSWVMYADSDKDAAEAIKIDDHRLLALSVRGAILPGISVEESDKVKQQCRFRYLTGMGDTIVNSEHRRWWRTGYNYAERYNKIMVKYCYTP